jgi:fatty-acyl-CoA synthase
VLNDAPDPASEFPTNERLDLDSSKLSQGSDRDSARKAWVRALENTAQIGKNPAVTLPDTIATLGDRFTTAPALLSERQKLTYEELAERSKQYSAWALKQGLSFGEVVCLLMPSCPEYLAIWLGITRVGGIVSLLNTNLVGDALLHAIGIVAPVHLIVDAQFAENLDGVAPRLPRNLRVWLYGEGVGRFARIDEELESSARADLAGAGYRRPTIFDRALYIYTSGTTGLPKAANVSHFRLLQWSHWFAGMMDTRPDDRMYNCLPMYHSVGGVVAIGSTLLNGGAVVLRERFSASRFWDEIVDSGCTIFQYIGELCRYLVNTKLHPKETQHHLRLACGNGLSAEVWTEFQSRFHIPKILEFYAATEGNLSLYNCEGRVGSIGRIPSFLGQRLSTALVEFDVERGEPVRNEAGLCVRCSTDQVGEAIGRIPPDGTSAAGRFEGYTDQTASEAKILRNVFAPGDAWFRTGDLMRRDKEGFFYFVDRVGDTFRWKGENVSTTEVAATICSSPDVLEAVVYGVTIPGTEGRAGMAAIVPGDNFDLGRFRDYLVERLPEYARPLFVRILAAIDLTGTFKWKKQDLSRESYDPGAVTDTIYFNDSSQPRLVKVDAAVYQRICSGKQRI